jgi:hypothetical protein
MPSTSLTSENVHVSCTYLPTYHSALQPWVRLGLLYNQSSLLSIPFHPFTFIFFRSLSTSSSHLILGIPFLLLEYSLPFNLHFGSALSSILSTCPNHLILCDLINLTISSPFSNVFMSSLYLILHHWSVHFAYYFSLEHSQCILFCYC